MKKIFFSIFAVAALALTSCAGGAGGAGSVNVMDMDPEQCDDTTYKCWKYTVSTAGYGVDTYTWGTQKTVVLACQAAGGVAGVTVTLTEVAADDAESCIAKN